MVTNDNEYIKMYINRYPSYINRLFDIINSLSTVITPDLEYRLLILYNDIFTDAYLNLKNIKNG